MIYIYRRKASEGAVRLADLVGGKKIRREDNALRLAGSSRHKVISWGEACPGALNGGPLLSKYEQAIKLASMGVPTVEVSRSLPDALTIDAAPDRPVEWLARRNTHVGGNDILRGITQGDFYSKKVLLRNEFRVHSFLGKSIRAGKSPSTPASTPGSARGTAGGGSSMMVYPADGSIVNWRLMPSRPSTWTSGR
jgi:hypothetical protein